MASNRNWFISMLSGTDGNVSSKRFFGGVGLSVMHGIAIFAVIAYPDSSWIGELLITLTVTDAGLLGVGVFEKDRKRSVGRHIVTDEDEEGLDGLTETYVEEFSGAGVDNPDIVPEPPAEVVTAAPSDVGKEVVDG